VEVGFALLLLSSGGFGLMRLYESTTKTKRQEAIKTTPKPIPKDRLEAICDGVFAVALTLLVVNIAATTEIPHLDDNWWPEFSPKLVAFVYSFWVVSVYWIAHHGELNILRELGGRKTRMREFLYVNLLFLLFIVILPFSAALIGTNWSVSVGTEHEDAGLIGWLLGSRKALGPLGREFWYVRIPFLTYAFNLLFAGMALQLVWLYISNRRAGDIDEERRDAFHLTTFKNWIIPSATVLVVVIGLACRVVFAQWTLVIVPLGYIAWTVWYGRIDNMRRSGGDTFQKIWPFGAVP